jgi:thioredoxin-dependent peroxiredoxin
MSTKLSLAIKVFIFLLLFQNEAIAQKLKVGEKAPNFEVTDANGNAIKLDQLKGKKVYVAFFRYAGCPICNFRIHELIQNYDSIKSEGYNIIAIYESSNATLKDYLADTPVPFSIVGDPDLKLYKKYGVEKSFWKTMRTPFRKQSREAMVKGSELFPEKYKRDGNRTRIHADFLIDENGLLKVVHYGKNIGDHLPVSEILSN